MHLHHGRFIPLLCRLVMVTSTSTTFAHTINLPEDLVAATEELQTVASGITFGEGPAIDSEGNLFFSDRDPSRIWKVPAGGIPAVFRTNANSANGMVFDDQDRLIVCEKNGLSRTEKDSTITRLFTADTLGNEGPNDLTLTSDGSVFFTSSEWNGAGKAYFWNAATSECKTILAYSYPPLNYPNGIEYIEEQKLLYINITRKDSVLKFHVNDDMSITPLGGFCKTSSPDGLAIDSKGNLWIANTGSSMITVFDSTGQKLGDITIDGQTGVQNMAFGGPDRTTLYITGKTVIFSLQTLVSGRSTTGKTGILPRHSQRPQQISTRQKPPSAFAEGFWTLDGRLLRGYGLSSHIPLCRQRAFILNLSGQPVR
jgi:gluconolactonase